jgi:hypothetical protein
VVDGVFIFDAESSGHDSNIGQPGKQGVSETKNHT